MTPQILFNYGHTQVSAGLAAWSVTPGVATAQGDMLYVNVTANWTNTSGQGTADGWTVTDSAGNLYNLVSFCGEEDVAAMPPALSRLNTVTFVSLYSVPLTISDTITITPIAEDQANFTGDVIAEGFNVSGPQGADLSVIYIGPDSRGNSGVPQLDVPANYSIPLPQLNATSEIIVATNCTFGTGILTDPSGWTKLQSKTQGAITQTTYYQEVSSNAATTFNPTLTNSTGQATNIVESYYATALPPINNVQAQTYTTELFSGALTLDNFTPTNFGDLIVVQVVILATTPRAPTVTDSQSNVYTAGSVTTGSGFAMYSFYNLSAKQLLAADSWTIDCSNSTGLSDATAAVMTASSCSGWAYGGAGAGLSSPSNVSPSYASGAIAHFPALAFGYVGASSPSTSPPYTNIADPPYASGWGFCPNTTNGAAQTAALNMYAQPITTGASMTLNPTIGSAVPSLLNIETFYLTGHPANPARPGAQPIVYADFLTGAYRLNGAGSSLGALFVQDPGYTGAVSVDANGLLAKVGTTKGSAPIASASLLSALNAQVATGLTVLIEFISEEYFQDGGDYLPSITFNSATGGVSLNQETPFSGHIFPKVELDAVLGGVHVRGNANTPGVYETISLGPRNMVAFNFSPADLNLSSLGQAVSTQATSDEMWPITKLFFGKPESQGVHVSFLAIYPLTAISDLALYSAPCTRPPLPPPFTQGHLMRKPPA